ncbi:MAG: DUF501 domain-containing protein [Chromatocurvus sp.]
MATDRQSEHNPLRVITQRLGREPRGLREVTVVDAEAAPVVIRVASVVDGRPFPTLYWLIDPALNYRIDRAEARGTIAELQARVDADPALQAAMARDHRRHIERREFFLSDTERAHLDETGQWSAIRERGIGGIADFTRIRCLHTWYAAHLVVANTVGSLLEALWSEEGPADQSGYVIVSDPQSPP